MMGTKGILSTNNSPSGVEDVFIKLDKDLEWDGRPVSLFWPATIHMDLDSPIKKNCHALLCPKGQPKQATIADRTRFVKIDTITRLSPVIQHQDTTATQTEINSSFEKGAYDPCSQIEHFCQLGLQKIPDATAQEKKEQRTKTLDMMTQLYGYLNRLQSAIDSEHPTETSLEKNHLTIASKVSVKRSSFDEEEEGCFADKDIKTDEKIGEYQGDIVFRKPTSGEEFIAFKMEKETEEVIFLEEDKYVAWTNVFLEGTHYEIGISGTTRLNKLNHSPKPNCALWVLIDGKYKDKESPEIPWEKLDQLRIDVQAITDISAGQELFFDYRAESKKQPINFDINLVGKPTTEQILEARSALKKSRYPSESKKSKMTQPDVEKSFNQQFKKLSDESKMLYNVNKANKGFCKILHKAVEKGVPLKSMLAMSIEEFETDDKDLWNSCLVIWSGLGTFRPALTDECENTLLALYISIGQLPEEIANKVDFSIQLYWHLSETHGTWQSYVEENLLGRRSGRSKVKRTAMLESSGPATLPRKKSKRALE
ncbi:SET domain-containing protein-lysine N-methyltransferase [Endozoicomonas atrinae]|uniref:SET domain-containing protein-lysine N-methyltransferase n=1 Tax=Endozoicomonas atrinae TaxID=1333660 RepID=UPI0008248D30|nr:SET domain-containing protein [Endozoicomonas atrinae]